MSRTHILLIFLLLPLTLRSQEDICIGKELVLYSTVLQEERSYWIHLPEHYNMDTKQRYPVVYLLDGDSFFHSLVGIRKTLASGRGKYLPPCIIVGVLNSDRTRDFTPTASAAGRDGKISIDAIPQGGGSEAFSKFLTEELRPAIDSAYRTNGWNMLIGHSYAGLFTLNTFLRHTELFDTYLAVDPSLWWDQGRLVREAEAVKPLLKQQVCAPVRWQQSVERLLADGVDTFVEIGPGHTLSGFMKKILKQAEVPADTVQVYNVETMDDFKEYMSK